jgi:hypothetical protein
VTQSRSTLGGAIADTGALSRRKPRPALQPAADTVQLAHVMGDKAEQAYRRSDAREKRRKLMNAWAAYLRAKGFGQRCADTQTKAYLK